MTSLLTPAVIIGASGGIGRALADAISDENYASDVVRLARSFEGDAHIDISDENSIAAAAARIVNSGIKPKLLLVATGLLHESELGPEKNMGQIERDWMAQNILINAIGPILVAKHFLPIMANDGPVRFAALSARVGSISDNRMGGWYGYRMSKAALNMGLKNLAIEWKRKNAKSIIVGLHPGTVDTPLSKPFQANVAKGKLFDADRAGLQLMDVLEELKSSDSGKIFAWDGSEITP